MPEPVDAAEIGRVFRSESGRAVASLVRFLGDIDLAEEAVQEAFAIALDRWPTAGLPPSPAGWIITTARNRAIDRLRREKTRDSRHRQALVLHADDEPRDRDVLSTDTKIGAANAPVHDQVAGDEFCGIDRDGKAESLCRKNDSGVDADHLAAGVDQRSAGISRIERGIGLDDIVD